MEENKIRKNIYALSNRDFNAILSQKGVWDSCVGEHNTAFIQISGQWDNVHLHFKEKHENVLNLHFDDVDKMHEHKIIDGVMVYHTPMSEEQAKLIVEFIIKNKNKASFLVHCYAGMSRSGGVVKWIAEYFDMSLQELVDSNPYIVPNARIVMMLRKAYDDISEGMQIGKAD